MLPRIIQTASECGDFCSSFARSSSTVLALNSRSAIDSRRISRRSDIRTSSRRCRSTRPPRSANSASIRRVRQQCCAGVRWLPPRKRVDQPGLHSPFPKPAWFRQDCGRGCHCGGGGKPRCFSCFGFSNTATRRRSTSVCSAAPAPSLQPRRACGARRARFRGPGRMRSALVPSLRALRGRLPR